MAANPTLPIATELFGAPKSSWKEARKAVKKFARTKPFGFLGGLIVLFFIFCAIFPQALAQFDPRELVGGRYDRVMTEAYDGFGGTYYLGTDDMGRDVFSRTVWGARVSIRVGIAAVLVGISAGVLLGLTAGYLGGPFDMATQRCVDAWMAFPGLILALFWVSMLDPGINTITWAIAITLWPGASRVVRSSVLAIKQTTYVEAARAIGCTTPRILFRHILPNIVAIYVVLISLSVGGAIITEASLTFLGLGIEPDVATWGNLVFQGTRSLFLVGWWLPIAPSVCIALTVYGFNMFGDGLRDTLDPRLRGSK